jgi:hypothetical protein
MNITASASELLLQLHNFAINNQFGSAFAAGALLLVITWFLRRARDVVDGKKILWFLQASAANTGHTYRSTEAIASGTKLPEVRVEYLCSRHSKIKRNTAERQSWRLAA